MDFFSLFFSTLQLRILHLFLNVYYTAVAYCALIRILNFLFFLVQNIWLFTLLDLFLIIFNNHKALTKYLILMRACDHYVTFSPSRSVRCVTNKPPAMRVRDEGYTKKTPNAIQ